MLQQLFDFGAIVLADLVLSGDNALIIGMAAASLSPELRKRAILFGIIVAAGLRIIFALVATRLLGVPGLLFLGSLLLFWVCWRLYGEIRDNIDREAAKALETAEHLDEGYTGPARKSLVRRCSRSPSPICRCRSTMFLPLLPLPTAIPRCWCSALVSPSC
jgi:predicted tellurium resistance membrane protein TerC